MRAIYIMEATDLDETEQAKVRGRITIARVAVVGRFYRMCYSRRNISFSLGSPSPSWGGRVASRFNLKRSPANVIISRLGLHWIGRIKAFDA